MKLSAANAEQYLRSRDYLAQHDRVTAQELSGGVSNVVIHVAIPGGTDLVLKQVREQLNVAEPWFCSVERIWREVDVLRHCANLVHVGRTIAPCSIEVPRILFVDRENHLYAMSAAPPGHVVWKQQLLAGTARKEIAFSCGTLLARLHAGSWHDASLSNQLNDRQYFDDLRLDPYYRQVARVHPDLAPAIERLIDSVWSERHSLVHGDFSPKNLLVHGDRLMLIDFEVGHYGDPAFDLGFFLSHLMLKAFCHAPRHDPYLNLCDEFWLGYQAEVAGVVLSHELDALIQRSIPNFAGCALARLDGKSKVDYLRDELRREQMRELCRMIFSSQLTRWADVRQIASQLLAVGPFATRDTRKNSR